jgi:hypothetical protein
MNKTDRRILATAALLFLGMLYLLYDDSLILPSDSSGTSVSVGKVSQAERDVRRKVSKQFLWRSAHNQDNLHAGDSLFTGPNSSARVELNDGRTLTVQENSLIVFSSKGDQLNLDLRFGRLAGNLNGCVKINIKGQEKEVCGNNSRVQVDATDGSVKVDAKPKELIVWAQPPPAKFYHSHHQNPLKMSWKTNQKFGRFRVQFSRQSDFDTIALEEKTFAKEISTKAYPASGDYYVRVQGDDLKGEEEAFSKPVKFTISEIAAPVITSPLANADFQVKTNVDGELLDSNQVIVEWKYSLKDVRFEMQLARDSAFSDIVSQSKEILGSNAKTTHLIAGTYYVRVRDATVVNDQHRPWSAAVSFRMNFSQAPKLPAPKLLTENIDYTAPSAEPVKLQWEPVKEAKKYLVTVSSDPDFQHTKEFKTEGTELKVQDFKSGRSYFKVTAMTEKGTLSEPSSTGQMQVRLKRPSLDPTSPLNILGKSPEDRGEPQTLKVSWSDLKYVDSYVIEVAEDKDFNTKTEYQSTSPNSEVHLPKPGDYFWRVRGVSKEGKPVTHFSDTGVLNYTLRVPLATPILLEPYDQMTLFFQKNNSTFVWFEWKPIRQATRYNLEIARDREFTQKVLSAQSSSQRFLLKEQLPESNLYWRIQAQGDDNRVSNWSEARQITVLSGRAPAGRSPSGRKTGVKGQ